MIPNRLTILDFYEFIYDRHMIWYRKEFLKNKFPWTNDPTLRTYKFCNVYRELDKGTKYLIKTIINNKNISLEDRFLNCIAYRRFNLPGFFEWIGGPVSCKKFEIGKYIHLLDKRKEKGLNLFNDAYIVSQTAYDKKPGVRKEKHIQQMLVLRGLTDGCSDAIKFFKGANLFEIHQNLKRNIFGMGDFLAYQTVTDLTYFPEFKRLWKINDFVAMGPGSKPGVDLLFPSVHTASYSQICKNLFSIQDQWFDELKRKKGKDWFKIYYRKAYYQDPYLSLSNIQNCLCEFRKYVTLQIDPNKRKRYYKPNVSS